MNLAKRSHGIFKRNLKIRNTKLTITVLLSIICNTIIFAQTHDFEDSTLSVLFDKNIQVWDFSNINTVPADLSAEQVSLSSSLDNDFSNFDSIKKVFQNSGLSQVYGVYGNGILSVSGITTDSVIHYLSMEHVISENSDLYCCFYLNHIFLTKTGSPILKFSILYHRSIEITSFDIEVFSDQSVINQLTNKKYTVSENQNNQVVISGKSEPFEYEVFNYLGELITKGSSTKSKNFEIKNRHPGVYFVKILDSAKEIEVHRIVLL